MFVFVLWIGEEGERSGSGSEGMDDEWIGVEVAILAGGETRVKPVVDGLGRWDGVDDVEPAVVYDWRRRRGWGDFADGCAGGGRRGEERVCFVGVGVDLAVRRARNRFVSRGGK